MSRLARIASLLSLVVLVAVSVGTFAGSSARADTSPLGCSANNLSVNLTRALAPGETGPSNASVVAQGQKVLYTVQVTNANGDGCDVEAAAVDLTLPASDGTATGAVINLDSGASFPADGGGDTVYLAVEYIVAVDPGVSHIVARVDVSGELQSTPLGQSGDVFAIAKTVSSTVANPSIDIEKATNGEDADSPTGPEIPVGDPISWTYVVTNTGNVTLTNVTVADDQGAVVTCPSTTLNPGASMVCTANGVATAGQYANVGTVAGTDITGQVVQDADPSHYFGFIPAEPAIDIEKATNGEDADSPTGPEIPVGDPVNWTYVVTNTGNVALSDVTVVDDQGVAVSCPQDTLAPGESMTCIGNGTAAEGQYANLGTATGTDPDGTTVADRDPSHYFGRTGGGEGCTPGFWKQQHHFWAWTAYDPSDSYSDVFGVSPSFGDKTLLQVLGQGGGGEIALGRHAVAALLNASSPGVEYLYSADQVKALVQHAYATGEFQAVKTLLEEQNEKHCDIGKKPKDDDCEDHKVSWNSKWSDDDDCDNRGEKKKDDRDDKKKKGESSKRSPFKGRGH